MAINLEELSRVSTDCKYFLEHFKSKKMAKIKSVFGYGLDPFRLLFTTISVIPFHNFRCEFCEALCMKRNLLAARWNWRSN